MSEENVQKFTVDGNILAYRKIGSGPATLIAFHGFGQTHEVFMSLKHVLTSQFTIFAVDLFFHGDSHYTKNSPLTKSDWYRLLTAFLEVHGIIRFSLMGFSLGGRFALTTAEAFAERLDQLFLIAPDGITQNFWYRVATKSALGRGLFQYVLHHFPILIQAGHGLVNVGLLDQTLMRFAEIALGVSKQREQAYQSWTQFRQIQPNLVTLATLINNQPIRVHFFVGSFDRIVPGSYVFPLIKKLRQYELMNLEARHNQLIELAGAILANAE